ncbi:DNA polymerase sliding clamp [Acidianus sulfidivorans JP7]|uniref:DNA polymerase sliding clamp n=1 Tax=Acidianus sulfidivorans JP7 TaxID=619593 RepID=A0A2U9IMM0_9CREN|nr:DNA polymerase sliding clamp [Acidianus sulfidivorans]AWR97184.1 DNA polymerase sliding clamp [Acidianus sulfidivorans JP7]
MFKAIYSNSLDFYHLITAVSKLTDNIIFNFTEDGILVRHLTDDKVLMCVVKLSKESLEDYEVEKPISVKINVNDIKKIMTKAKSKNSSIELSETDSGLKIVVIDEKNGTKSNIYIKAEKGSIEEIKEPNVSLSVSASLSGDILKTVIDDSLKISEEVEFSANNDSIMVSSEEAGKSYTAVLKNQQPLSDLTIEGPAKAVYSGEVLKTVATAVGFSDTLKISFGNNLPMKTEVSLYKDAILAFWIAPRM